MTRDARPDPETEESFREALGELVAAAHRNDVSVERAWEFRRDDDLPDWEVEVVRLSMEGATEESPDRS